MLKFKVGDICKQITAEIGENPIVEIVNIRFCNEGRLDIAHKHKNANRICYSGELTETEANRWFITIKKIKQFGIVAFMNNTTNI